MKLALTCMVYDKFVIHKVVSNSARIKDGYNFLQNTFVDQLD